MATIAKHHADGVLWGGSGSGRSRWGWALFLGIVLVLIGIFSIAMPLVSSLAVAMLIGSVLIASGIVQTVEAIRGYHEHARWASFLMAALTLIAGVLLLWYPFEGLMSLTLLLAAFFVAEGLVKIGWSVALRRRKGWGWLLANGILSACLGIFILAFWPVTSAWVLGTLVGIDLIMGGSVIMALASAFHHAFERLDSSQSQTLPR